VVYQAYDALALVSASDVQPLSPAAYLFVYSVSLMSQSYPVNDTVLHIRRSFTDESLLLPGTFSSSHHPKINVLAYECHADHYFQGLAIIILRT